MKFPVILKLLVPLILGVIVHFYLGFFVSIWILLGLLILTVLIASPLASKVHFFDKAFHFVAPFLFFLIGGFLSHIHKSNENEKYFANLGEGWNNYLVRVIETPEEKARSIKCVVEVNEVDGQPSCGKSILYLEKDTNVLWPKYGDLLYFNGRFNAIKSNGNPKEFDYARYLQIHDIYHQTYIKTEKWKKVGNEANPIFEYVYCLRGYFSEVIANSGMTDKNAMVANALLLGQKEFLDKDVLRSYSSAGAMHVLAVSGLHVGIVMLILNFLFSPFKKIKHGKKLFLLVVVGGIWFYAFITGLSPSVMRAAVMFTFIVIGKELQRDTTIYQSIMVSAFLLILIEPYIIFQVGFQLSYLAVLGIVYLQPKIENLIYIKNKILYKAWQISAVSIAAQIATFPLGLYYFHQFPNFFLVSNLLVIPLAFFILIVGITYLTLHFIPILSDVLFWIFDGLISILNWGVEWVEKLPYSIMWGISIEWYEVFLLYITILLGSVAFIHRKTKVFFASLIGVIILLGFNIYENQKLKNEDVLYIYNINDELAIDVFYGRQNIFYSTPFLKEDEQKLLFHVKHNWFYRTGQEHPTTWVNSEEIDFLEVGESTFALLDSNDHKNYQDSIPNTDYFILNDIEYVDQRILNHAIEHNTTLILASGVGYKARNYIKSQKELMIYDIREEGAFEYYFY